MSTALQRPQSHLSDAAWQTRCDLAALYRIADHLGWTDLINTHISARLPDDSDTFLINPYGQMFDEITASSLVKMDMDGNVLGSPADVNNAGFVIHSGVYKARPDAMCVVHTHTRAGAGVALIEAGLRPISQDALAVIDEVAYHPYGIPASREECEALGRSCQHGTCIVLLNHGLLTLGPTIHGAFMRMYMLERACELELTARMINVPPGRIDQYVIDKAAERGKKRRNSPEYGLAEFQALIRTIDRKGAQYRL